MINYWEYLVPNIVINYVITTYWECLFIFFSVNIVIKLFARFLKKINIVVNYWECLVLGEYLVPNIVINYVITIYWEYSFFIYLFFVSVNIVINNMLGLKKKLIL